MTIRAFRLGTLGLVAVVLLPAAPAHAAAVSASPERTPTFNGAVWAVAYDGDTIYLGGDFTAAVVSGRSVTRARLAAFDLGSGALDGSWRPAANGTVQAVVAAGGRVYVGGKFGAVNGISGTARLAAVHPASGAVEPSFRPGSADEVRGLAVSGSSVYAAHGGPGGRVVAYATDGRGRWNLTMDGDPQAITVLGDAVYFGGHFDNVCRSPRTGAKGSCLDGSIKRVKLGAAATGDGTLLTWTANANGAAGVHALAASGRLGKLGAGGAFTKINGAAQPYFAQFG